MKLYEEYFQEKDNNERPHLLKRPSAFVGQQVMLTGLQAHMYKKHPLPGKWQTMQGAFVAAQVILLALQIYNLYLTKAARACKGNKFKLACMNEYKIKGMEKTISVLKSSLSKCKNTDKPDECKNKINKKIDQLEKRKDRLQKDIKYWKSPRFFS